MAGWRPVRLAIGADEREPLAGAQLLLRRMPLVGWHLAYVPRGPIGRLDDPAVRDALVAALRALGRAERIATVRVDPEVGIGDALRRRALLPPMARRATEVQPPHHAADRPVARRGGAARRPASASTASTSTRRSATASRIERFDGTSPPKQIGPALADFNRIYHLTAERAGFVARAPAYYERVWSLFAPAGRASLSFAARRRRAGGDALPLHCAAIARSRRTAG